MAGGSLLPVALSQQAGEANLSRAAIGKDTWMAPLIKMTRGWEEGSPSAPAVAHPRWAPLAPCDCSNGEVSTDDQALTVGRKSISILKGT